MMLWLPFQNTRRFWCKLSTCQGEKFKNLIFLKIIINSVEAYGELKEQLGLKEGEVEKAKFTTQGLSEQEVHLKSQMTRVRF